MIGNGLGRTSGWVMAVAAAVFLMSGAGARGATFKDIKWVTGPATVPLGTVGTLKVPPGYRFTDAAGIKVFNELTHNLDNDEFGLLAPPVAKGEADSMPWFIVYSFNAMGYVKDGEKLDDEAVDKIFKSLKDATEAGNTERKNRGWDPMTITKWDHRPFYDPATHHVTWAIRVSGHGESTNYFSKVLGRHGVMSVNMVLAPEDLDATVPTYNKMVENVSFNSGENYSEYRSGDKIAEYGLVGLITGGAAVAAVKFWKPLMKFGAFIVAGIAAVFAKIKRKFTRKG